MALADGSYRLGPEAGRLLLKTGRTGLGSKAGHDLTIEVTSWSGTATVDTTNPVNSTAEVDIDVDSLEVREGTGGLKPLTDGDRADIKKNIRQKILHTDRHPKITFRSTQVAGSPDHFTITGDLTITGTTRPATVTGNITADGTIHATATITQTTWDIKPFSAFFGALKLADAVTLEITASLTEPA